jgi:hypothetical protein
LEPSPDGTDGIAVGLPIGIRAIAWTGTMLVAMVIRFRAGEHDE